MLVNSWLQASSCPRFIMVALCTGLLLSPSCSVVIPSIMLHKDKRLNQPTGHIIVFLITWSLGLPPSCQITLVKEMYCLKTVLICFLKSIIQNVKSQAQQYCSIAYFNSGYRWNTLQTWILSQVHRRRMQLVKKEWNYSWRWSFKRTIHSLESETLCGSSFY